MNKNNIRRGVPADAADESVHRGWPSPSTPMTLSEVAGHTTIARSTYVRAIRKIEAGEDPNCRSPQIERIARLFAAAGGPSSMIYASRVIEAFGETPERTAPKEPVPEGDAPPKRTPKRQRFGKKEAALFRRIPAEEARERLTEAVERLRTQNNQANRGRVEALVAALLRAGADLPQIRVIGSDLRDIRAFGSFGEFMARSVQGSDEAWVFVRSASGRPIDFDSAEPEDFAGGATVALTRDEYLAELALADRNERDARASSMERALIEGGTDRPNKDGAEPGRGI